VRRISPVTHIIIIHAPTASIHHGTCVATSHTAAATVTTPAARAKRRRSRASRCGHEQFSRSLSGVHITA
jgi:hypothetical protein